MKNDANKVVKGFIIGIVGYFLITFLIMVGLSYLPNWRISSSLVGMEYFAANLMDNFGLKLVIATFGSIVITGIIAPITFSKSGPKNEK